MRSVAAVIVEDLWIAEVDGDDDFAQTARLAHHSLNSVSDEHNVQLCAKAFGVGMLG